MNRASLLSALLLCSAFSPGQNAGWQAAPPTPALRSLSPIMAARLSNLTGACPVSLRAQRRGTGSIIAIDGSRTEVAQKVRLTFGNLQGKDIIAATVTVHGYDATPRLMPVRSYSAGSAELKKTVELKLTVASGKDGATDLTMRSFASVSGIDLESLEYADGTDWHASGGSVCHVEPDLLVLVGAK